MLKIINFIKLEFSGWNKFEKMLIPLLFLILIGSSLWLKDSKIATIQAIFSLSYTIMAGKGKISCYFFGILGTLCYSYLSFKNTLYGNLILNMGYFFPVQIAGIFAWKNRLKKENQEIIRTQLKNTERVTLTAIIVISSAILSLILQNIGDKFPILDACSTIFSMFAMYLTLKRCIEQWLLWTFVNIISVSMWLIIYMSGSHTFATMLIWAIHLFLGIYFFFKWKKDIEMQNKSACPMLKD